MYRSKMNIDVNIIIPKIMKFEANYESFQNQAISVLETRQMMNYVILINQKGHQSQFLEYDNFFYNF